VKLDMEVVETPGGTRFFMKATDSKGATIYDNEPFEKSELLMCRRVAHGQGTGSDMATSAVACARIRVS